MNLKKIIFAVIVLFSAMSCTNRDNEKTNAESSRMNNTIETILNRKSVRVYSDNEIPQSDIQTILKAAMASPSSKDGRPWHFIVINDKETLHQLAEKLPNASMVKNANKAIIVCGDTTLSPNNWYIDGSAATQNILLAAESLGIGSVWTAVYPYEDRAEALNQVIPLPENIRALSLIPLGYPAREETPKDKFDESRIHLEKW